MNPINEIFNQPIKTNQFLLSKISLIKPLQFIIIKYIGVKKFEFKYLDQIKKSWPSWFKNPIIKNIPWEKHKWFYWERLDVRDWLSIKLQKDKLENIKIYKEMIVVMEISRDGIIYFIY
jgi:hypothetical protein